MVNILMIHLKNGTAQIGFQNRGVKYEKWNAVGGVRPPGRPTALMSVLQSRMRPLRSSDFIRSRGSIVLLVHIMDEIVFNKIDIVAPLFGACFKSCSEMAKMGLPSGRCNRVVLVTELFSSSGQMAGDQMGQGLHMFRNIDGFALFNVVNEFLKLVKGAQYHVDHLGSGNDFPAPDHVQNILDLMRKIADIVQSEESRAATLWNARCEKPCSPVRDQNQDRASSMSRRSVSMSARCSRVSSRNISRMLSSIARSSVKAST